MRSILFHYKQFPSGEIDGQYQCCSICDRTGVHNSVDSHKNRENDHQRQQKDHLSGKGYNDTQNCFAHRGKEAGRHWLDTINKSKQHKNFQISFCKLEIKVASASESSYDLVREKLETKEENYSNRSTDSRRILISLPDSVEFFRPVIKSPDRLGTLRYTNADGHKYHIDLGDDAYTGNRNVASINRGGSIMTEYIVHNNLYCSNGKLIDTGCKSQRTDRFQQCKLWAKHIRFQFHFAEF